MSYDLAFWKQHSAIDLTPGEIHAKLSDCPKGVSPLDGIAPLPWAEIYDACKSIFPGLYRSGENSWDWSSDFSDYIDDYPEILAEYGHVPASPWLKDVGGFVCYHTPFLLVFSFNVSIVQPMRSVVDMLAAFGCPVYDAQWARRAPASTAQPSASRDDTPISGLNLTLEGLPEKNSPSLSELDAAIDSLNPYGGPGFLILDGFGDDYAQVAGSLGAYTAEWRITEPDNSFHHWVAGLPGCSSEKMVSIPTNGSYVEVRANEELSREDAKTIIRAFASRKGLPKEYLWNDITARFADHPFLL